MALRHPSAQPDVQRLPLGDFTLTWEVVINIRNSQPPSRFISWSARPVKSLLHHLSRRSQMVMRMT